MEAKAQKISRTLNENSTQLRDLFVTGACSHAALTDDVSVVVRSARALPTLVQVTRHLCGDDVHFDARHVTRAEEPVRVATRVDVDFPHDDVTELVRLFICLRCLQFRIVRTVQIGCCTNCTIAM